MIINHLNDCRWNLLDKIFQKTTSRFKPLFGIFELIESGSLCGVMVAPGLSYLTHPILRMIYLYSSLVAYIYINAKNELSKKIWVKKEIKQICKGSTGKAKKLVYIAASFSDKHNAFPSAFFNFRTKSNLERLSKLYEVHFIEGKTEEGLEKKIAKLTDRDIDVLIVQCHGSQTVMRISRDYVIRKDALGIFNTLAGKLKEGANISLISCSTGKGEDNIAKAISNCCANAIVFAPKEIYYIPEGSSIHDDGSCTFLNGNSITAFFAERKDITRVYNNGQAIK